MSTESPGDATATANPGDVSNEGRWIWQQGLGSAPQQQAADSTHAWRGYGGWARDGPRDWWASWWRGGWERPDSDSWAKYQWGESWSDRPGYTGGPRRQQAEPATVGDANDESRRRGSVQSTEATISTDEHVAVDEQDPRDSDLGSSGSKATPKTGKDYVPEFNGTTSMREYERRVRLFESSTGIDPSYRAQKLMERLSGAAWSASESIELEELKHP